MNTLSLLNRSHRLSLSVFGTLCLLALLIATRSLGDDGIARGPRGGQLFSDGEHSAEVSVQKQSGDISIQFLRDRGPLPPLVAFTFRDRNDRARTLELSAVRLPGQDTPTYRGNLSGQAALGDLPSGSFVGIEIRIPWSRKKSSVLRPVQQSP